MSTVYLHVGTMKSGTTYLQHVLLGNKARLGDLGVLFPGAAWGDQVTAAQDLIERHPNGKRVAPGAWDRLVKEVLQHKGPAIISMETLGSASVDQARRAVESFAPRRVRVIVTARDIGRVIPAQWQEWIQNGGTAPYGRYLKAAAAVGSDMVPIARRPWWGQDLARILGAWQPSVDPSDLVLVTVPPAGSDRSLLWQRFCEAVDLPADSFDLAVQSNESLGAVSAELLRRVNIEVKRRGEPWATKVRIKQRLGRRVLAARRTNEPSLILPERYYEMAVSSAKRIVAEAVNVGPVVIGDLDDLLVTADTLREASSSARGTLSRPEDLTSDELLEAAIDGLVGLVRRSDAQER